MLLAACLIIAIALLGAITHLTNPFNRLTIIRMPFRIKRLVPLEVVDQSERMHTHGLMAWRWLAIVQCGLYILHTRYGGSRRARGTDVATIINNIHQRRFRPDRLLLISGDHFNGLFVRNLGVFYYPTLDTAIKSSPDGWRDRQMVYAQTLAYGLMVFAKRPIPTTTIVESGPYAATLVNFYAYPSDTVYGLLYALAALHGLESARPAAYGDVEQQLETMAVAGYLQDRYRQTLQQLYKHYRHTVYDPAGSLVRRNVHLSGAKDITRRQSAFYDNVIFWKTSQLAMRLGLIDNDPAFLRSLKRRIIKRFWLPEQGYFLEDLSEEGERQQFYSSDWLIVLATGFLDPAKPRERTYYVRCMQYIHEQQLDQPLPLRYHAERRAHRQFLAVRLAVASYGGDAIWSFWGMEYLKCLLLLHRETGEASYLDKADAHIAGYQQTMVRLGGFPEVMDQRLHLLQTPLYRGIRQTGWVIGFEQVLAMRTAIDTPS